jgi:hypothetical protein
MFRRYYNETPSGVRARIDDAGAEVILRPK